MYDGAKKKRQNKTRARMSRTKQNKRRLDKIRLVKPIQVKLSLVKTRQDNKARPMCPKKGTKKTGEDWKI